MGKDAGRAYLRKWWMIYFMDIPIFLLCFRFSLRIGYSITLLAAFAYLAVAAAVDAAKMSALKKRAAAVN